ncbi:hypothetical protein KY328_00410 [Candidatus Woesearchaeota archaeon]|nr:hypothetical protein [Candidatus Woesearchaeota archaeon]
MRDSRSFEEHSKGRGRRDSSRDFKRGNRNKRDFVKTKVTCSSCGTECEVPFRPTSTKPVYCDDCFAKKGGKTSNKDLDLINEKLDKIMVALKIE